MNTLLSRQEINFEHLYPEELSALERLRLIDDGRSAISAREVEAWMRSNKDREEMGHVMLRLFPVRLYGQREIRFDDSITLENLVAVGFEEIEMIHVHAARFRIKHHEIRVNFWPSTLGSPEDQNWYVSSSSAKELPLVSWMKPKNMGDVWRMLSQMQSEQDKQNASL